MYDYPMGVENLLQISGYEVHHFTNAEDALAANAVGYCRFDVIPV